MLEVRDNDVMGLHNVDCEQSGEHSWKKKGMGLSSSQDHFGMDRAQVKRANDNRPLCPPLLVFLSGQMRIERRRMFVTAKLKIDQQTRRAIIDGFSTQTI
jgi:hypothetical protein